MTVKVLFVCLGNICRSPTAEGLFRAALRDNGLEQSIDVDSCGTAGYHVGEPPDPRSVQVARERGIDISRLRARRLQAQDFDLFDYILVMDQQNLREVQSRQPAKGRARVSLFLDFAENAETKEVPDPYYGGAEGFQRVLDLIEKASTGLLADIRAHHREALGNP